MIDRLVAPDHEFSRRPRRSSGGREPPPSRIDPPPRRRRRGGGLLLKAFVALLSVGLVAGVAFAGFAFVYFVRVTEDLPAIEDLAEYEPPVMSRVQSGDGRLIAEYGRESRVFVPIETIPRPLIDAFLSAEDKNFYRHNGIEPIGMFRAQLRNVANMVRGVDAPLQGGSTITQQVAKNFKLDAAQTIERKVREIALTFRIEQALTKDQILELYMNEIYLGFRAYGVAAAGLLYFGKPLDELSLSEMAYLAAVPRAPNNYHPILNKERAIERRNWVLDRMVANGVLDAAEADIAKRDDLVVVVDRLSGSTYQAAEYFVEEVRRAAFSMYGEDDLYDGGLSIRTTLDTGLQIAARRALRDGLEAYDRRHGFRGPIATIEGGEGWQERLITLPSENVDLDADWARAVVLGVGDQDVRIGFIDGSEGNIPQTELAVFSPAATLNVGDVIYAKPLGPEPETQEPRDGQFSLRQLPAVNGAIVAIDPHTGRVLAMVGGYSFRLSQFNRATQANRQPGSSFKPFVYAAALDNGYTPVSKVLDGPYVSPAGVDGTFYKPANYEGRWYGQMTLRRGVEMSRNTMTVRLANAMGLEHMSEYAERFGIYDDLPPYESMALGAGETTLWRMVTAYGELVNGGLRIEPTILDRVQDRDGGTIYRHDQRVCTGCTVDPETQDWATVAPPQVSDPRERVIDAVTAYQIVSILQGVVDRGTAAGSVGRLDWPLAGKTGTSNDFKDAWFVGFSPDLVAGVYIGFDSPRSLGNNESGGIIAAPIFRDFMAAALENEPKTPFRSPPGVLHVPVNAETGALARQGEPGMIWEAFRPGTEPTRYEEAADRDTTFSPALDRPRGGITIAGPFEERSESTSRGTTVTAPERGGRPSTGGAAPGESLGGSVGGSTTVVSPSTGGTAPRSLGTPAAAPATPPAGATTGSTSNPFATSSTGAGAPADTTAQQSGGGLGSLLDRLQSAGPSGGGGAPTTSTTTAPATSAPATSAPSAPGATPPSESADAIPEDDAEAGGGLGSLLDRLEAAGPASGAEGLD